MPVSMLTSKGQITLPKEVRKSLNLKPSDRVIITVEKGYAILKPVHGNILDLGGSVKIPKGKKPIDFKKVRREAQKAIAKRELTFF